MSKLKVNLTSEVSRGALLAIETDFNLSVEVYDTNNTISEEKFNPNSAYWMYSGRDDWQPVIDKITEYQLPVTFETI